MQRHSAIQSQHEELESEGLYLTHLFDEARVILRPNWREQALTLEIPGLHFIAPKRPATIDLILTNEDTFYIEADSVSFAFAHRSN